MANAVDREQLERRIVAAVREALDVTVVAIDWLDAHLSLRSFARVHLDSADVPSLVARVEAAEDPAGRPPGIPPEPRLEPIRALLERAGLPVPCRYGGGGGDAQLDLLEDVGSTPLRDATLEAPEERRALYREACDLVPRLQAIAPAPGVAAFERSLDDAHFAYKAELFIDHSLPELGRSPTAAEATAVREAFAAVADVARHAPRRLAHRDLQSANLHLRPDRAAGSRLVMIDLQGAFLAPPEYDLVSLLHDSYVELSEAEIAEHLDRVRPALPDSPSRDEFLARFDLLTLTRKGKDHARYLYAARERGDTRFLRYVGTSVRLLRRAATRAARRDPRIADLAALIHELPESACAR